MEYKFSELFKWKSGKPLQLSNEGYPVYGSNGIIGYCSESKFENKIILGRVGAYCGSVEYCKGKFNATDNTLIAECDQTKILYQYAYYLFKQYNLNNYACGSAQPLITQSILKHLKCNIFDIKFQEKIINILNNYDQLIENNNKRIKLLEDMAESLYKEWFVRFRFLGHEKVETKLQSAKGWTFGCRENEQLIPKNWNFKELIKIAEFKRGKNITSSEMIEGNVPVIAAGLEPSGYHNKANVKGYNLTISASGANAGYMTYHLEDIWAADCSYYQNDDNLWFVYNALKFLQPVISNMQIGSAQPHVYAKNINKLSTIIPSKKLIKFFADKVKPIYEEIKILKEKNELLAKQRDSSLPRLMSGKLSVEGKEVI